MTTWACLVLIATSIHVDVRLSRPWSNGAYGEYIGIFKVINIDPALSSSERDYTLVHELAHALDHDHGPMSGKQALAYAVTREVYRAWGRKGPWEGLWSYEAHYAWRYMAEEDRRAAAIQDVTARILARCPGGER